MVKWFQLECDKRYVQVGTVGFLATAAVVAWITSLPAHSWTPNILPISWDNSLNQSFPHRQNGQHPGDVTGDNMLFSEKNGGKLKLVVVSRLPAYRERWEDRVMGCGGYRCLFSNNRSRMSEADGIIVDAFLISRHDPKPTRANPNQVWVFFTKEPWINFKHRISLEDWDSIFNWTATYQNNSDIVIPYNTLRHAHSSREDAHWSRVLKRKTRSVLWFVSNCRTSSRREVYVRELSKHIDVDVVGQCGTPTCDGDVDYAHVCYQKYRFYLAFENAFCKDYLTEKFFRTFSHPIIPIVRGYVNHTRLLPRSDLFINTADFQSPRDLAKYLRDLEKNSTAYTVLLKKHAQYRAVSGGNGQCAVCRRLHRLDEYRRSYSSVADFMQCHDSVNPHFQ